MGKAGGPQLRLREAELPGEDRAVVRGGGRILKLNELIRIEQAVAGIKLASFSIR